MKIIKLQASNIKKLSAISIAPDGNVVTLAGDNGAGKSSVLDAIAYALGGTSGVCEQPIRRGESEAEIVCQLNGLTITRKFNAGGSTLKVEDADGKRQSSPQAILDKLVGNLAFDPLEFARKKDADQAETLRKLVGIDFAALDAEKVRAYNDRLLVGREVDVLKGKLSGNIPMADAPVEEVSITEALEKKNAATARNKANEIERDILQKIQEDGNRTTSERVRIDGEIALTETRLASLKADREKVVAHVVHLSGEWNRQHEIVRNRVDEDVKVFDAQILEAEKINAAVRANKEHAAQTAECRLKSDTYNKYTELIDGIDAEKRRQLAAVKFPLPELSFSASGGVTYNGFPFSQASDGEKLRVSVAIGMALNPKLRVIFIRDGSLLDANGLKVVAELAAANEYQVWLEDARSVDPTAVVIEDGHIKG